MDNKEIIDQLRANIAAIEAEAEEKKKPLMQALLALGYVEIHPVSIPAAKRVDPKAHLSDPAFLKFKEKADEEVLGYFVDHKGRHEMPKVRDFLMVKFGIEKYKREVTLTVGRIITKLVQHKNLSEIENKGAIGGNSGEAKYSYELKKKELVRKKPGPKKKKRA